VFYAGSGSFLGFDKNEFVLVTQYHTGTYRSLRRMKHWIYLSKNGEDQYIDMLARSAGGKITSTEDFVYDHCDRPIVLRGILKHKIMHQCWQDGRDFYYVDTGYFGNQVCAANPLGTKLWHRIVRNDLQHADIVPRPGDRLQRLNITFGPRRHGRTVLIAAPDEKPCRFYGIDRLEWIAATMATLQQHTDRPIQVRERHPQRQHRVLQDPLSAVLTQDIHALVTFNSAAAIESVLAGVPAFVMAPTHAAAPVANRDLAQIETPEWPDQDKLHAWACHLSYGQFHVRELQDGTAMRILHEH